MSSFNGNNWNRPFPPSSGGFTDGTYGEITISSGGTVFTVGTLPHTRISGLGTLATQSGTFSGTSSGINTGDQTNITGNAGTVTNGVYTTDVGTVTNTMLAGSIASNKLVNSAVANLSGVNTGDQTLPNTFSTIAVSGQSNVVADSTTDTLTLVAGSNITITTNATTGEITITGAAGGSGITNGQAIMLSKGFFI